MSRYNNSRNQDSMMDWTGPVQTQSQKQRSMEASKERIYKIHGNVINILEELEERTQRSRGKKPLPKSKTDYYDHSEKDDETVDEVVQGQLITFQSIIKTCDPRVKQSVKDELEKKTKKWMEVRRQEGADRDDIDRYAHMMLDIITHGQTSHSKDFLKSKSVNHDAFTHEDVQTIITASHKSAAVDREFQRDPNRKAKPYEIRSPGKDTRFINISGFNQRLLALMSDGKVLSFEDESEKWKIVLQENEHTIRLTQIYEMPGDHKVIAVDDNGGILNSDRTLKTWRDNSIPERAVLRIVVGCEQVLAIDEKSDIWQAEDTGDGLLKWNVFTAFQVSRKLISLAIGKYESWAINDEGRICRSDTTNSWTTITSQPDGKNFSDIYCNAINNQVWVRDESGNAYLYNKVYNTWTMEKGPKIQTLAILNGSVIGLDKNNDLWHRKSSGIEVHWDRMDSAKDILASC